MAWIEFHQTMPRGKKTLKLAELLKISRREAIGLMCDLWTWALDNADKDGTLSAITPVQIADALGFGAKQAKRLVDALCEARYMDFDGDNYILHNWYDYAGKLLDRREADKRRKETAKNSYGIPTEIQRDFRSIPTETQQNASGNPCATVPYRTVPSNKTTPLPPLDEFSEAMRATIRDWLSYKEERREKYKPTGLSKFLTMTRNSIAQYGEKAVVFAFTQSMAANYQGVVWQKAERYAAEPPEDFYKKL